MPVAASDRDDCFHGEEKIICGDKGYANDELNKKCRAEGKTYAILDKAKKNQKLSTKQKKRNKKLASLRAKVEHPFHTIKNIFGHKKVRYRGLAKNTNAFQTLFALTNLHKFRHQLS